MCGRLGLPPEQLQEPGSCCIRRGCSSHMCHLVSRSLQTWCCWWLRLLLGIPGEVQVQISAHSVGERTSCRFGLDVPLTRVHTHFLSALLQRISCLGHHQIARKGWDHCCLVGETIGAHGTCLGGGKNSISHSILTAIICSCSLSEYTIRVLSITYSANQ